MCTNDRSSLVKDPFTFGISIGNSMTGFLPGLEHYRLQLYHYAMAERMRLSQQIQNQQTQHILGRSVNDRNLDSRHVNIEPGFSAPLPMYPAGAVYARNLAFSMALLNPHNQQVPEEPKPQHSYIGLIAMAILSSQEKKLVLSDIYQYILEHYPYFRRRGPGWRNSIRHNLSLNDCFIKSGRSANGKGHYWAIHPANIEDFRRGDFRRRKAQRKVRRHMGLAVDEEPDSPSPPPISVSPPSTNAFQIPLPNQSNLEIWRQQHLYTQRSFQTIDSQIYQPASFQPSKKRQFDVASLLAPDDDHAETSFNHCKTHKFSCSEDEQEEEDSEIDINAVTEASKSVKNISSEDMECNLKWENRTLFNSRNQLPVTFKTIM